VLKIYVALVCRRASVRIESATGMNREKPRPSQHGFEGVLGNLKEESQWLS